MSDPRPWVVRAFDRVCGGYLVERHRTRDAACERCYDLPPRQYTGGRVSYEPRTLEDMPPSDGDQGGQYGDLR